MKCVHTFLLHSTAAVVVALCLPVDLRAQWFEWYDAPEIADTEGFAKSVAAMAPTDDGILIAGGIYGSPVRAYAQFRRMNGEEVWSVIFPTLEDPDRDNAMLSASHTVFASTSPEGGWWVWVHYLTTSHPTFENSFSIRYHVDINGRIAGEERVAGFGTRVLPDGGIAHSTLLGGANLTSTSHAFYLSNTETGDFDSTTIDLARVLRTFRGHPKVTSWSMSRDYAVLLLADDLTYESAVVTVSMNTGAMQAVRLDGEDDPLYAFNVHLLSDGSPAILARDISWGPERSSTLKLLWLGAEVGVVQRIETDIEYSHGYTIAGALQNGELLLTGYNEHINSLYRIDSQGEITGRLPLPGVGSSLQPEIGPNDRIWLRWSTSLFGLIAEPGTITSVSDDPPGELGEWGLDLSSW